MNLDFYDVFYGGLLVIEMMVEVIIEVDNFVVIVYYLGQNLEEVVWIVGMSFFGVSCVIGCIEVKFEVQVVFVVVEQMCQFE